MEKKATNRRNLRLMIENVRSERKIKDNENGNHIKPDDSDGKHRTTT